MPRLSVQEFYDQTSEAFEAFAHKHTTFANEVDDALIMLREDLEEDIQALREQVSKLEEAKQQKKLKINKTKWVR